MSIQTRKFGIPQYKQTRTFAFLPGGAGGVITQYDITYRTDTYIPD